MKNKFYIFLLVCFVIGQIIGYGIVFSVATDEWISGNNYTPAHLILRNWVDAFIIGMVFCAILLFLLLFGGINLD